MQFHSNPIEEHDEVPLADDGRFEQIVERWRALAPASTSGAKPATRPTPSSGQRDATPCYVVSVGDRGPKAQAQLAEEAQLAEIVALVGAQGGEVLGSELQRCVRPNPRSYLGSGTCEAIADRARAAGASMLVIDAELSPSQARNIEDLTGLSVCDREAVILNVFLLHARTRKARIQIEIAQLEYLRPRIRGIGLNMDQQAGGLARGRGPGETASELLARQLDGRLVELRRQHARLERRGAHQRERREGCARVALVGYTNAGKTSLMNALTAAGLSARDMPFETLDTTTRCLSRHGGEVLISDTVGFIRRLPQRLYASFDTTLAEIREATLIAVVIDLSDPEWTLHLDTTTAVLARLGADDLPRLYVFNKVDQLATRPDELELRGRCGEADYLLVSSHDPESITDLEDRLLALARRGDRRARIVLPYAASALINQAYASCRVLESEALEHGLALELEGPASILDALERGTQ